jgi:hypothetical protein
MRRAGDRVMARNGLIIVFALVGLVACSPELHSHATNSKTSGQVQSSQSRNAKVPVESVGLSSTFTFHGYTCGGDCSSHQAGYDWAAKNAVANPALCTGNSESFIEGCRAYAGIEGPVGDHEEIKDED